MNELVQTKTALLEMIALGIAEPSEAQALADGKGVGELLPSDDPNSPLMNPETVPRWNLAMAIAWIAMRDLKHVRYCWGRFERYQWVPTGSGYVPQRIPPITASQLVHQATIRPDRAEELGNPREAGLDLFTRLANGELTAASLNVLKNEVVSLSAHEWNFLLLGSPANIYEDWLHYEGARPHLRDALFDWKDLYRIWPRSDEASHLSAGEVLPAAEPASSTPSVCHADADVTLNARQVVKVFPKLLGEQPVDAVIETAPTEATVILRSPITSNSDGTPEPLRRFLCEYLLAEHGGKWPPSTVSLSKIRDGMITWVTLEYGRAVARQLGKTATSSISRFRGNQPAFDKTMEWVRAQTQR